MNNNELVDLIEENKVLKEKIKILQDERKSWAQLIDQKVDNWFEKYKDDVDIGRISVFEFMGQKCEIDVLPDEMEKALYKKCIKIIFSMLAEFNMK